MAVIIGMILGNPILHCNIHTRPVFALVDFGSDDFERIASTFTVWFILFRKQ